jgi:hypothetical protein
MISASVDYCKLGPVLNVRSNSTSDLLELELAVGALRIRTDWPVLYRGKVERNETTAHWTAEVCLRCNLTDLGRAHLVLSGVAFVLAGSLAAFNDQQKN